VTLDARPERTSHHADDEVTLFTDSTVPQRVRATVTHLGEPVTDADHEVSPGRGRLPLGRFPIGSYAVRLTTADGGAATTAFDVTAGALDRPRYGFVTDFVPGRDDGEQVADSWRAFHLNAIQFYDWMYRHASLLPPSDDFVDALDRSLSLATVRRLLAATHAAGSRAIAYAAVYGAGRDYAD
jgi:dextranase